MVAEIIFWEDKAVWPFFISHFSSSSLLKLFGTLEYG
jgi:hypothetical protein